MTGTELVPVSAASLERAASFLRRGEVVAFPTETVYGLGADALNPAAVAKIFRAKERPADNPLIAHIASLEMLDTLVSQASETARLLMERFWPGPLTLVLPKGDAVPDIVSAGLATVGVRMPSHPAARALILAAGLPIAAPSANRSGRPSPTTAQHVLADMDGRIPLILDGGPCAVGLESTVLDMTGPCPTVLRPGGVTVEMLRQALPEVAVDEAVLRPLAEGASAPSPGMRHRHYAPKARVIIVAGEAAPVAAKTKALYAGFAADGQRPAILCAESSARAYGGLYTHTYGDGAEAMAAGLFSALRDLDAQGVDVILAEAADPGGMGLAVMNRLLRAADFHVVQA